MLPAKIHRLAETLKRKTTAELVHILRTSRDPDQCDAAWLVWKDRLDARCNRKGGKANIG